MGIRELSPELAKKAKDELNEDPARIPEDLKAIKEWIGKQSHLKVRMDDQWLIAFLRGCKYSLERTKEKLDLFYTMKSIAPELSVAKDPMDPLVQEILTAGVLVCLSKTVKPDDPRVFIMRFGQYDPDKVSMVQVVQVCGMIGHYMMMNDDQSVIAGAYVIIDLGNVSRAHFTIMSPSLMKKMTMNGQDASPSRQKGTHYINFPTTAERILEFSKNFMNEKTKSRLRFHKNFDELHKVFPKAILPTEYGGDAGPIQDLVDDTKKKVESYRDWYLEDMQYKTDESKRVGSPKTSESVFGIEGSFRQLNVD